MNDADAESDVDAALADLPLRVTTERVRERREQAGAAFDQDHARHVSREAGVIPPQHHAQQLRQGPRVLDPGGPSPDDDERQPPPPLRLVDTPFGELETDEDAVPQP